MSHHERDHVHELLADAVLDRLTPEQEAELEQIFVEGGEDEKLSFEVTAAALNLAFISRGGLQTMPPSARVRLEAAGRAWSATHASGPIPLQRSVLRSGGTRRRLVALSPWLAAAAGVTLAVLAWSPYSKADPIKLVEQDPKTIEVPFAFALRADGADKTPQDKPIGCVCWNEGQQSGVLKLHPAFPCNDCEHQFQLWIIDWRGDGQRVSAGIFDCKSAAECKIFFRPSLPVHDVKSFAITMETPGGMPAPDIAHTVAIGHCGKKH